MKNELKRSIGKTAAITAILFGLVIALGARAHDSEPQEGRSGQNDTMPSMMEMMEHCQQVADKTMEQCQEIRNELTAARDSGDPERMRAAIDNALQACAKMSQSVSGSMKEMMNTCRGMMGMMEMMHGGMMMGRGDAQDR